MLPVFKSQKSHGWCLQIFVNLLLRGKQIHEQNCHRVQPAAHWDQREAGSASKQKHLSRAARHGTSCPSALKSFELVWMPLTEEIWLSLAITYLIFTRYFLSFHTSVLLSGEKMTHREPRILGEILCWPSWVSYWFSTAGTDVAGGYCPLYLARNEDVMLQVAEGIFPEGRRSQGGQCWHHWVASPNQQPLPFKCLPG